MSQVSFPSQFTRSKKYTNLDRLAVEGAFEIYQMQRKNLRIWPLKFFFFFFSDKMIFNSYGNENGENLTSLNHLEILRTALRVLMFNNN